MEGRSTVLLLAVVGLSWVGAAEGWWWWRKNECAKVSTVEGLNVTEYVRATWYVQMQQETGYQSKDELYCVTATYELEGKRVPFFGGEVVSVYNYANKGAVNGPAQNAGNRPLCARVKDEAEASKLVVAPCFLPNFLAGPYWVVAVGGRAGTYEWAIVSGGQPTEKTANGCTTKRSGINGSGFWFFTRERVADEKTLSEMKAVAKAKGFTLDFLLPVAQAGCDYQGARIKP